MKTILILILALVLGVVAYLTKPTENDFRQFLAQPVERTADTPLGRVTLTVDPVLLDEYEYRDRVLWATVSHEGETVYLGAFSQWFRWGDVPETTVQETTPWQPESTPADAEV